MADVFAELAMDLERDLPRCPRPAIVRALADSWRDFCKRAMVWRYPITLNRTEGQAAYPLDIPYQAEVVQFDGAWTMPEAYQLSLAHYFFTQDAGRWVLNLKQAPSATVENGLKVVAVLAPERNFLLVDDEDVFLRFQEGVVGGALRELAGKPRRPWSSGQLAAKGRNDFNNAVSCGLADRVRGMKRALGLVG